MALADNWRRIADKHRRLPALFGLREHSVKLLHTTYTKGLGKGGAETCGFDILVNGQNPKVRFPSQREVALGYMSMGEVTIGPFTPKFSEKNGDGVERALLSGEGLDTGELLHVKVTGPQFPNGNLFTIKNCNVDRALRVTIVCSPAGNATTEEVY